MSEVLLQENVTEPCPAAAAEKAAAEKALAAAGALLLLLFLLLDAREVWPPTSPTSCLIAGPSDPQSWFLLLLLLFLLLLLLLLSLLLLRLLLLLFGDISYLFFILCFSFFSTGEFSSSLECENRPESGDISCVFRLFHLLSADEWRSKPHFPPREFPREFPCEKYDARSLVKLTSMTENPKVEWYCKRKGRRKKNRNIRISLPDSFPNRFAYTAHIVRRPTFPTALQ